MSHRTRVHDRSARPGSPGQTAAHVDVGFARPCAGPARSLELDRIGVSRRVVILCTCYRHTRYAYEYFGGRVVAATGPHATAPAVNLPRRKHPLSCADRSSAAIDDRGGNTPDRYLPLGRNRQPCAAYECTWLPLRSRIHATDLAIEAWRDLDLLIKLLLCKSHSYAYYKNHCAHNVRAVKATTHATQHQSQARLSRGRGVGSAAPVGGGARRHPGPPLCR